MCLHPQSVPPVPEETARIARAAFPRSSLCMRMRDAFETLVTDEAFADLFPTRGQPAEAPWRLALVTLLQFVENLTDRQAAEAVRSRIDWKYLLSLDMEDPGFDASVLSEFRTRLLERGAQERLFRELLRRFCEHGLVRAGGKQRTDSTHVLAHVRTLGRLEMLTETMRHALNALSGWVPEWMRAHTPPEWWQRYADRSEQYRLPQTAAQREQLAECVGADGALLLASIYQDPRSALLGQVEEVEILRRVWVQQYWMQEGRLCLRPANELAPAPLLIQSPHDAQARYAHKRSTQWVGYRVHLSETCDAERPRLITHVETAAAPVADSERTDAIHAGLQQKDLLPDTHLVDSGYVDAEQLVRSRQQFGVDLCGPAPKDTSWQAKEGQGFSASDFAVDWQGQQARCPGGKTSIVWQPQLKEGQPVIRMAFDPHDCASCSLRMDCTHTRKGAREVVLRPQEQHEALRTARQREKTAAFEQVYALRAGVEGSLSQGVRAFGLRECRYIGEAKTHLQHLLTAAAINFVRVGHWFAGTPTARTRRCAFARLQTQAA